MLGQRVNWTSRRALGQDICRTAGPQGPHGFMPRTQLITLLPNALEHLLELGAPVVHPVNPRHALFWHLPYE